MDTPFIDEERTTFDSSFNQSKASKIILIDPFSGLEERKRKEMEAFLEEESAFILNNESLIEDWVSFIKGDALNRVLSKSAVAEENKSCVGNLNDIRGDGIHASKCIQTGHCEKQKSMIGRTDHTKLCPNQEINETSKPNCQLLPSMTDGSSSCNILYAQLFFDIETKELVTLVEEMQDTQSEESDNTSHSFNNQNGLQSRRMPLHFSASVLMNDNGQKVLNGDTTMCNEDIDEWVEFPTLDETLLTECSSISSETSANEEENWAFNNIKFDHILSCVPSKTRFPEEPVVFSNDESMNQDLCWMQNTEIDIYLLQDSDDVWDYDTSKASRCTDSLKKILAASRFCISLPEIGEFKWRATNNLDKSYLGISKSTKGTNKVKRTPYSVLLD